MDRRRIWVVVAVASAIAVVALASGAGVDTSQASVSPGFNDTVEAIFWWSVAAFLTVMAVVILWLWFGGGGPRRERRRRSPWGFLIGLTLLVIVVWLVGPARRDLSDHSEGRTALEGPLGTQPESEGRPATTEQSWDLAIAGIVILALVAIAAGARGSGRPRALADDTGPVITTEEARDEALARAHAAADPREAILLAFAAAESVLSRDPGTRRPSARSAREWATAVGLPALTRLVGRYEIARFSHHTVTEDDRRVALDALGELA